MIGWIVGCCLLFHLIVFLRDCSLSVAYVYYLGFVLVSIVVWFGLLRCLLRGLVWWRFGLVGNAFVVLLDCFLLFDCLRLSLWFGAGILVWV